MRMLGFFSSQFVLFSRSPFVPKDLRKMFSQWIYPSQKRRDIALEFASVAQTSTSFVDFQLTFSFWNNFNSNAWAWIIDVCFFSSSIITDCCVALHVAGCRLQGVYVKGVVAEIHWPVTFVMNRTVLHTTVLFSHVLPIYMKNMKRRLRHLGISNISCIFNVFPQIFSLQLDDHKPIIIFRMIRCLDFHLMMIELFYYSNYTYLSCQCKILR